MGSVIDGFASMFGKGPKVEQVQSAPAVELAPTPESQGKTLTDTEADRLKSSVAKKRLGTKSLQIPLVGTQATVSSTATGINTGGM